MLTIKQITKIDVATNDIVWSRRKVKKIRQIKPETEEKTPKRILTNIDELNVFVTCFDAAAGINSMLKTKIIPTV